MWREREREGRRVESGTLNDDDALLTRRRRREFAGAILWGRDLVFAVT